MQSVSLKKYLKEITVYYENLCKENNIHFVNAISQEQDLMVDQFLFSSVLNDLFTNALKFTPS